MSKLIHLVYLTAIILSFLVGNNLAKTAQSDVSVKLQGKSSVTINGSQVAPVQPIERSDLPTMYVTPSSSTNRYIPEEDTAITEEQFNELSQHDSAQLFYHKLAAMATS